jgi:hypothetical protein
MGKMVIKRLVMRCVLLCLTLPLLAACYITTTVETPFDPKAHAFIHASGSGTIEGEAFVRRDYGRIVTAAGEKVFLIPATPYTLERFEKMFTGDKRAYFGAMIEGTPPEYVTYRREAKVDMAGRFRFEHLTQGRYIVATRVFWTEPDDYFPHGGAIYDVVDVKADEVTKAVISGK